MALVLHDEREHARVGPTHDHRREPAPVIVRVLVVDDQPAFRRAASLVIGRAPGFLHVGDATTGEDGVRLAVELRADLVLMDVNLPGIDGIEATRRLLGPAADVASPLVLLVSTRVLQDLPDDVAGCGAVGYVRKEHLTPTVLRDVWAEPDRRWRGAIGEP